MDIAKLGSNTPRTEESKNRKSQVRMESDIEAWGGAEGG